NLELNINPSDVNEAGINGSKKSLRKYFCSEKTRLFFFPMSDDDCQRYVESIRNSQHQIDPEKELSPDDILNGIENEIRELDTLHYTEVFQRYQMATPDQRDRFKREMIGKYNRLVDY